ATAWQADARAGLGLRPAGAEGHPEGVPQQARRGPRQRQGRQEPPRPAPRLLRLLRLALGRARPLDAGAPVASVPLPPREEADPRRPGRAPDREEPPD